MPIIGSAYSRAREYSSDLHGLKCCKQPKDAVFAMAVLAMGADQWNKLNVRAYAEQSQESGGFWMSFHEITADYPWLSKRMQHLLNTASNQESDFPRRSSFAWFLALFVPRIGVGSSAGGLVSVMIVVAIIGILAAIALPAYQGYIKKAKLAETSLEAPSPITAYDNSIETNQANISQAVGQWTQEEKLAKRPAVIPAEKLSENDQRVKIKAQKALRMASELEIMIGQYIVETGEYPSGLQDIGVPEKTSTQEIGKIEMTGQGGCDLN